MLGFDGACGDSVGPIEIIGGVGLGLAYILHQELQNYFQNPISSEEEEIDDEEIEEDEYEEEIEEKRDEEGDEDLIKPSYKVLYGPDKPRKLKKSRNALEMEKLKRILAKVQKYPQTLFGQKVENHPCYEDLKKLTKNQRKFIKAHVITKTFETIKGRTQIVQFVDPQADDYQKTLDELEMLCHRIQNPVCRFLEENRRESGSLEDEIIEIVLDSEYESDEESGVDSEEYEGGDEEEVEKVKQVYIEQYEIEQEESEEESDGESEEIKERIEQVKKELEKTKVEVKQVVNKLDQTTKELDQALKEARQVNQVQLVFHTEEVQHVEQIEEIRPVCICEVIDQDFKIAHMNRYIEDQGQQKTLTRFDPPVQAKLPANYASQYPEYRLFSEVNDPFDDLLACRIEMIKMARIGEAWP